MARQAHRREYLPSWLGRAQRAGERIGWWPRLAVAGLAGLALPLLGLGGFQLQVGIDALVIALLAVGLNIVVGWAGLLDLGYIAFFGFGAYGYALLSSAQLGSAGIHLPYYLSLPIVMIGAALLGLGVGLPSRRLIGDYLAIVTLFLGEAFVEFTNNVAPSKLGGPNGITGIDPIKIFGIQLTTNAGYYYLLVIVLAVTMAVLRLLDNSRTGRAWRAVREDPLAAAAMTIPVNRVKLLAFACGAMVAALAGTIYAAQQASVFPTDFDTPILILIYAGLILGGAGSIAGAVTGALVVMVIFDGLLRSPAEASVLFYGLVLLTLLARLRPWRRLGAVLAATVALGFAAHAIARAVSASAVAGGPQSGGWIADALRDWVIVPANAQVAGNFGFVALICLLVALVQVSSRWRTILLPPTLYLASFVWETRLVVEPSITRQLMIGAILIVMMNARPQGLLGTAARRGRHVSAAPEPAAHVLELDHLSLSFGGLLALSELDLRVGDREVVSVIGPNGAGKTTVFNVITGVYKPSAGDVRFGRGVDRGPSAPCHRPARDRAHVPDLAAVHEHVRDRERDGRHLRPDQGHAVGVGAAAAAGPARGTRGPGAGRGGAFVLRPAARRVPLGPARLLAVVREPAAAGDRPGARHPAPAAAARRAGCRDEPGRDARGHRADRAAPR